MNEWRPCPGFPSYEVSEDGAVRRIKGAKSSAAGRLLNGHVTSKGYRTYALYWGKSVGKFIFAHRLVCEAWHGACPVGKTDVAHGDGDKLNNHFSNLRWATRAENEADKDRHGTRPKGEQHWIAKRRAAALKHTRGIA